MAYISEKQLVNELAYDWSNKKKQVVKELTIPIVHQIYYDNYLEGRETVRIDDQDSDQIIFVEAENGLYLQHPQIYIPFCNLLYILCPEDKSSFRADQIDWSREQGIGVIERKDSGELYESVNPIERRISPNVQAFVKSRLFRKFEKERKKNAKSNN